MTHFNANLATPAALHPILGGTFGRDQLDTYEQVAQRVRQVYDVLAERGIRVRQGSSLSQFLRRAEALDREWSAGKRSDISVLCATAHVNKAAQAVLMLRDDPAVQEPLRRMASNVMMPDDRRQSQGKDALWEIVLLAHLRGVHVIEEMYLTPNRTVANGRTCPSFNQDHRKPKAPIATLAPSLLVAGIHLASSAHAMHCNRVLTSSTALVESESQYGV